MEAKQVIKDTLILNIKKLKRIPLVEAYKHLNQRKTSYKAHHPNRYSAIIYWGRISRSYILIFLLEKVQKNSAATGWWYLWQKPISHPVCTVKYYHVFHMIFLFLCLQDISLQCVEEIIFTEPRGNVFGSDWWKLVF